ncbi:MAG: hypothetical protein QG639_500 [Patescibacteria group bacterium]|nr:hypothetical protein [Patescibacteria group bacterium]
MQALGCTFQTMKYNRKDYLKIFAILMSTVLLYLSIQELRVALTGSSAAAQTAPCTTPTPTPSPIPSATPSPTPVATPLPTNAVFLTEFMACPNTGNEWIELYNASDAPVEATGWQIIDATNNKKTIYGTIAPLSFSTFEWSGSLLNNTGDLFSVVTTTGQVIAQANYEMCSSGISFVYENGEWVPAIASPNEDTEVSENTATSAAIISDLYQVSTTDHTDYSFTSLISEELSSLSNTSFPYLLPVYQPSAEEETIQKNISTQQAKSSTAPAVSVILGGLLQLLSGSYAIYDNYIKQHA